MPISRRITYLVTVAAVGLLTIGVMLVFLPTEANINENLEHVLSPQPTDNHLSTAVGSVDPYPSLEPTLVVTQSELLTTNSISVTIRIDRLVLHKSTHANSVASLLEELELNLSAADFVTPTKEARLINGMIITVNRANQITVIDNNARIQVVGHYTDALDVVVAAGIVLDEDDYLVPQTGVDLGTTNEIRVIRTQYRNEFDDSIVPYKTTWQGLDDLELDQRQILQEGTNGLLRRQITVRFENGVEVERQITGEWFETAPVDEIIGYGTQVVVRQLDTPTGTLDYWRVVRMWATSYTAASAGKPPDHPRYGITASGRKAGFGIVAVDPDVIPFRSQIYVPEYGVAFAGDTGGGVQGLIVDLGYDEGELKSWNRFVDVYYLTPVPPADQINYVLPLP